MTVLPEWGSWLDQIGPTGLLWWGAAKATTDLRLMYTHSHRLPQNLGQADIGDIKQSKKVPLRQSAWRS
jgi:hypothetical protein